MRPITLTLAIAVAAVATVISAADLEASAVQDTVLRVERMAATNPAAQAHIERGRELVGEGKYGTARREYRAAAAIIRADGDFPATALHAEAAAFYFEGLYRSAAMALDDLADEAAEWGDVVTYAWALSDAAWVLGRDGAKIDVERRVNQLSRVLRSPYIPDHVRREIMSKRLGEATTLVRP